jgi:sirohydrochlorin cobaltochelatase
MLDPTARALGAELEESCCIGEIFIRRMPAGGLVLSHRDDEWSDGAETFRHAEAAVEIAKYDDAGNYRPLKTAPTLRHGWRLELVDLGELRRALDYFYPGRLTMWCAWKQDRLATTPLRETLDRQSGMYRVAARISDEQMDEVVGNFCRSDGGCLRTILWRHDATGGIASTKFLPQKFDPSYDQTGRGQRAIPLLCQEPCHLLVNECRKAVKCE